MLNNNNAIVFNFSYEWERIYLLKLYKVDLNTSFKTFFSTFSWYLNTYESKVFDKRSCSVRWVKTIASKFKNLNCIILSKSIKSGKRNLKINNMLQKSVLEDFKFFFKQPFWFAVAKDKKGLN